MRSATWEKVMMSALLCLWIRHTSARPRLSSCWATLPRRSVCLGGSPRRSSRWAVVVVRVLRVSPGFTLLLLQALCKEMVLADVALVEKGDLVH